MAVPVSRIRRVTHHHVLNGHTKRACFMCASAVRMHTCALCTGRLQSVIDHQILSGGTWHFAVSRRVT